MKDYKTDTNKIKEILEKFSVQAEILEFSESTKTSEEAAKAIGCSVGQIAKSIIFKGKTSEKPILVIASGLNRVNEKKLAEIIGEEIEKANANFVREKTGFVIGGVPPFGHKEKILTFIDEDLMKYEFIWAAAGTPNSVFKIKPEELVKITQGSLTSLS
ncbi:MAG: YbaK/EbsC family protein [Dictyoglomaceae bacterium]|nr:YbaK/EbsC family protein [Dictyoglomaceae bacterium]HPP16106.1 YbaK/EbsC family protein [Dictyoglomaceae bacterium]HPU43041.1 YbaK/EbsC family protein [Dictyoglomaceae bacterium]